MVLLQKKVSNQGLSVTQDVSLSNIVTNSYELNQVQNFLNDAVSNVSFLLNNKKNNYVVLNTTQLQSVTADNFLTFNNIYFDPYSISLNNTGFIAPFDGIYEVFCNLYLQNTDGAGVTELSIFKNTEKISVFAYQTQITFCQSLNMSILLNQGDLIRFYTSKNISMLFDGILSNQIGMRWL